MDKNIINELAGKLADAVPGESVTLGRAPTNTIVVKDERCSRNHAEVFQAQGSWKLRDLESRNGTMVSGEQLTTDHSLEPGDIILTGTPAGVGPIVAGDRVEVDIEGIGTLMNPVANA